MHLKRNICRRAAAAALAGLLLAGCTRPAVLQPPEASSLPASSAQDGSGTGSALPARFAIAVSEGSYNPYLNANTLTEQVAACCLKSWSASPPGWSWRCAWPTR